MSRYDRIQAAVERSTAAHAVRKQLIADGLPDPAAGSLLSYRAAANELLVARAMATRGTFTAEMDDFEDRADMAMIAGLDAGATVAEISEIDEAVSTWW